MLNASLRLMRFDKPIGIYLLLWPTCWALWLSAKGHPNIWTLLIFVVGTVLMRAAGCIMNDIADRDIDPHVARTHLRPLASGELSLKYAVMLFGCLLFSASLLLFFLPIECFYLALIGVLLTVLYPLCKRFFKTPQLILGLAFSWGIPMAYAATIHHVSVEAGLLMGITFFWIVVYDTMYAMADKVDDLKIGVHSTAIFFGSYDKLVIGVLQLLIMIAWFFFAWQHDFSLYFYLIAGSAGLLFVYQQILIQARHPKDCFRAFLNNHWYGLMMWVAIVLAYI